MSGHAHRWYSDSKERIFCMDCGDLCKVETTPDEAWNAALEAAEKAIDAAFEADEDVSAQEVIRALKREVR